ncbi:MAG TPA: hypothetical protein VFR37_01550 [Longimicrobium sp.]|nr:hypothetical protein [Longimicrobium sp.]
MTAPDPASLLTPPGVRGRAWPHLVVGGVSLCALLALVDDLSRREVVTLFKVTAESERVELTVEAGGTDPIRLSGASVQDDCRTLAGVTGDLRLADGVRVVLTRIGEDPVLTLVAEAPEGGSSVGMLQPDGGAPVELQGGAAITLPLAASDATPARRASLHFAARDVRIGARWRPGTAGATQPLLRSGRVSLIGLAQGDVPFEAQSFELGPYETITDFPDPRPPAEQPLWWGTVTAEAGTGMRTTFAVMDTRIALWRGSVPYRLGVTVFDHLRGHPRFALFCAVFVILALIAVSLVSHALRNAIDRRATTVFTRI